MRTHRVQAWVLYRLSRTAKWVSAAQLSAAAAEVGVGARELRRARERLLADGFMRRRKHGYQGPWQYACAQGLGRQTFHFRRDGRV